MNNSSYTDEQLLNLINNEILELGEFEISDFTGGYVQVTSTHNNTNTSYKLALFFGYKNKKPVTRMIDIHSDFYNVYSEAIRFKTESLRVRKIGANIDELNRKMNNNISKKNSSEKSRPTTPPTSRPTPTLPTTSLPTTIITSLPNNDKKEIFDLFWKSYPRKVNKAKAEVAFMRLLKEMPDIDTLLNILEQFKNSNEWKKDSGKFIPHPTTWLNGKRWEDELVQHIDVISQTSSFGMNVFDLIEAKEATHTQEAING